VLSIPENDEECSENEDSLSRTHDEVTERDSTPLQVG